MFRLSSKIILAFSIIIISGTILMVSIISYSTRAGYETFVKDNDKKMATGMGRLLEEYYKEFQTWDGVENYFEIPKSRMMITENGNKRRVSGYPPIIVTDTNGDIVLNTQNKITTKIKLAEHGLSIKFRNQIVGYIYTGSMIEKSLTQEEESFLAKIKTIIILVSLLILTVSIIFTYLLSKRITKPITDLSKAATDIQNGIYDSRVKSSGNDELSRLTVSFNQMAAAIENNDQWRKQIIADSAHELRTPVTLIQGNLELILEGVYKPDQDHIQGIYDETQVLSRLIKELQELSSAESGSMEMVFQSINVSELIDNSMEIFGSEAVKKSISFNKTVKNSSINIKGDFQKIKQVVSNVLANAFRHTPENGQIEVKVEQTKHTVNITILDSGSGIPENELEKVFERFYRTDSSRNRVAGGSGLGLSISREIIKLHRGTIHAEYHENCGATFIITLPL